MTPLNLIQGVFLCLWTAFIVSLSLVIIAIAAFAGGKTSIPLWLSHKIWAPIALKILGARVETLRTATLDPKKPYVFLSNHCSMLDIPAFLAAADRHPHFIAKKELMYVPFAGWFIWGTGMIFIDRSNHAKALESLKQAAAKVRDGKSILAYPEGTRSRTGELLPFKKGPFMLAIDAGVPIVPVAIRGSGQVWAADGFRVRSGKVQVIVGEPVATTEYGVDKKDALIERVRAEMQKLLSEIDQRNQASSA